MTKRRHGGWYGDKHRHKLSALGIKNKDAKQHLTPVVLFVFLVIGLLAFVPPEASALTLASEDFDSTSVGSLPSGWVNHSDGGSTFEVSSTDFNSSANSLQAENDGVSNNDADGYFDLGSGITANMNVTFAYRRTGTAVTIGTVCVGPSLGSAPDVGTCGTIRAAIRGNSANLALWDDSANSWITTSVASTAWNDIRFDINFTDSTIGYYINEVLETTVSTGVSMTSVRYFGVYHGDLGTNVMQQYVDDWSIVDGTILTITTSAVTTGTINTAYSYDADSNSILTETWSHTLGFAWLTIDSGTGVATGTPTLGGYYNIIVQVVAGADGTATQDYNISVNGTIAITSTATTTATISTSYSYNAGSNYRSNETWACDVCPSWLTIDSVTGVFSGVPTAIGDVSVTISVDTDIVGDDGPATQAFTISVGGGGGGGVIPGDDVGDGDLNIYWGDYGWYFFQPNEDLVPPDPYICDINSNILTFEETSVKPAGILISIWDFGDGGQPVTTTGNVIVHEYPGVGIYTLTYSIALSGGGIIRNSLDVTIGSCAFPTLTTPILAVLVGTIATLGTAWVVFAFTRSGRLKKWAIIGTFVAIAVWTVYLVLFA